MILVCPVVFADLIGRFRGLTIWSTVGCAHWKLSGWRTTGVASCFLLLRMLTIDYEALVADLEGESRRLIEFLGLDWEAACLDFYKTERPVLTASAWQVRQPLFTRS